MDVAFNSLSRDHIILDEDFGSRRYQLTFNSLSRDHELKAKE